MKNKFTKPKPWRRDVQVTKEMKKNEFPMQRAEKKAKVGKNRSKLVRKCDETKQDIGKEEHTNYQEKGNGRSLGEI